MKLLQLLLLLAIASCVALKPLKMQRVDNLSNRIRMDGIYVCNNSRSAGLCGVYVFYKNGVIFIFRSDHKVVDCINYWKQYNREKFDFDDVPFWWGIYQLNSESILFEGWLSTDYYYPTYTYSGNILNDSTICIKESTSVDTFRFVEFSPKPDSTNAFIK